MVFSTGHGDTTRLVRRTWDPVPVPDSLRERDFQLIVSGVKQRMGEAAVASFHLSDIPTTAPAWNWLQTDDRGNIWVFRTPPERDRTVDIFDPLGRWLGVIPVPWRRFSSAGIEIRGGKVYLATENEDGLPMIRRFVIRDGQVKR